MKFKELVKKGEVIFKKNSPAIFTGITIVGIASLTFMNIYPKVKKIMEEHRDEMDGLRVNEISGAKSEIIKKERCAKTVKDIAKASLPPVLIGGVSIAASLSANTISSKRLAAVSAAYELTSRSLSNLKDSIEDVVPKKVKEIREEAAARNIKGDDVEHIGCVYSTGRGDVLCKDKYTGLYFRSSMDEIEKSINRLSARVRVDMWVSLSDFYFDLNIPPNKIPAVSRDIGWDVDSCIEGNLPILVVTTLDDTGNIPVLALDYEVDPRNLKEGRPLCFLTNFKKGE